VKARKKLDFGSTDAGRVFLIIKSGFIDLFCVTWWLSKNLDTWCLL